MGKTCKLHTTATTYLIGFGNFWNLICRVVMESEASLPVIIACLSTRSFGFCVQGLPGGICLQIMETGKIPTAGFAVGGTKETGKDSLKSSSVSLILNG